MTQKTTGLYSLVKVPSFYEAIQRALGSETSRRALVDLYIKPKTGDRVLDLGCGPVTILSYLGDVAYVGVASNSDHVASARAKRTAGKVSFSPASLTSSRRASRSRSTS